MLAVVVGARWSMVRRGGAERSLWFALATLDAGQCLQVERVYRLVEHAIGVPGSAAVLKHSFAVLAAAGVRGLLVGVTGEDVPTHRGRHVALAAAAITLMVIPFALAPPHRLPAGLEHRAEYYDPTWRSVLHWAGFLPYLSWALGGCVRTCWLYGRPAPKGPTRTGLLLIGAGGVLGFGYVALKVVMVTAWVRGHGPALTALDVHAEALVLAVTIVLMSTGSMWEVLDQHLATARAAGRARRSLRSLYPLWRDLHELSPAIALSPGRARPAPLATPASLQLQLVRRVVEIRDGLLLLQPFMPAAGCGPARTAAAAAGLTGDDADAAALAACVHAGRAAKRAARPPSPTSAGVLPGSGDDLAQEADWLARVSRAYSSCPTTRAIAGRLHAPMGI